MFDAAVIGAGPAGALCAARLARAGARVALVDGSHPREKPCGGGVTGRALGLSGLDSAIPGQAISSARFETGTASVTIAIEDAETLRVHDRSTFDGQLLARAIACGAVHVPARVTAIWRDGSGWIVEAGSRSLAAAWIVGADGAAGITRKQVARPFSRRELSIAAGSYVAGATTSEIAIAFTTDPAGYLWSFPRRDHLAVGACAQADETSPLILHQITDRWLETYPPARQRQRRRYAWPIPSLPAAVIDAQPTSGPGWLLVGDAAGLVDPITREGIYFAVESAIAAADALRSVDPSQEYAAHLRDTMHAELRRAADLKAVFFQPRFVRLLIEALRESAAIRAVMIDLIGGRQPYATLKRRLLGTLEFGLMARVLFRGVAR